MLNFKMYIKIYFSISFFGKMQLFEAKLKVKIGNRWQTTYIWMACIFP